ncbi:nuclear transport factor 2 family protein [Thalassotalea profundi]|uniref:Transcriptional regulator n=1 Tax=Thalassotalea profundi TaxID=2036687 RepID=A0ABQ3IF64_9GAMM|nr:nuclear transport factor 2 family protein [Thalassotalea profundi]GHE81380.1 transcriptional regulator [Thalassotalea profundi]
MQRNVDSKLSSQSELWLKDFIDVYQTLSTKNLGLLETIYHKEVTFIDPIHQIEGLDNLHRYFQHLYENLSSCDFVIEHVISQEKEAAIYWQMSYQHPKLNKGKIVEVQGSSHIKSQEDKIIYHRDYLDLGAMLYEQLPVFGQLTKWIKTRAAN